MSLSDIAISNRVFSWMLMVSLIFFGGICFKRMGVGQLPDVDFPVVNISVTLLGAAPEVIEVDVVDVIEDALTSIAGVSSISSKSRSGSANITVEFSLNKDIDTAVQEVQNAVLRVQRMLPKDIDPPVISKSNPEDQPILWLAVTSSKMKEADLMAYIRDHIKDRFSTIAGVGEVFLGGYVDPNLRVWLSADKLQRHALTASDIVQAIQLEHAELPAGRIVSEKQEFNIRSLGEAPTAEQFGQIPITRRGGSPNFSSTKLSDLARVEEGLADIRRRSRSMGIPAVGLGIKKQSGTNAVEVAHAVKARLKDISLPEGTEIGVRYDSTKFIEEATEELNFTLILSAILTAVVCWMFLGSWSATLNVIMAIPTSIVGSFAVLYALGFTLNTFTLLGLSLAIGIVVDDAIMVLENIVRHKEEGKTRMEAARVGAREITFAAIAATAAIIAIFLPVAFMQGIIGKYFFQFGVTLSVAVAISLLEALTLTPMRCSEYLEVGERTSWLGRLVEGAFAKSTRAYERILPSLLKHPVWVLSATLIVFAASIVTIRWLKKEFVPAQDQSSLTVRIQTPMGASLSYTDTQMKLVENYFMSQPEVDKYFASVGGFGGDVNTATISLSLKPKSERPKDKELKRALTQQELAVKFRKDLRRFKELRITIQDPSLAGFTAKRGFPIEFTVQGPDWTTLIGEANKMMSGMDDSGLMIDVDSDYQSGMPEVQILPNRKRAQERGVTVVDIGQTVNTMMGGLTAGRFSKGGHRYDVRVQLEEKERLKPEDLKRLFVRNNRGEMVPLSEVVTIKTTESLQAISRQDRQRAISVFANVSPGASQEQAIQKVQELGKTLLPGYEVVMRGSAQTYQESFQSLIVALFLGLVVSYMVLGSQFNSFLHPVTVLVALPFSVSGAFLALWVSGQSLNIYSMIGLILLMGIVKKNSILLVDFTNQCRDQGLGAYDALIKACPMRLRPILMTSIATIVGAIPAAMAIGPGAESRAPMAIAVIGGVIVSTALTLFAVPCMYKITARGARA